MNAIIIYQSSTGFTERYANWIAEALDCAAVSLHQATPTVLAERDIILYGGGLRAGQIRGLKKFRALLQKAGRQADIVFATGAAPGEVQPDGAQKAQNGLSAEAFFYFQSGLRYERLSAVNRWLLVMMRKMLSAKKEKTAQEAAMADVLQASFDISSRAQIEPLLRAAKALEKA